MLLYSLFMFQQEGKIALFSKLFGNDWTILMKFSKISHPKTDTSSGKVQSEHLKVGKVL